MSWHKVPNKVDSYQLGEEPVVIHIIKTGFKDKYIVVCEDAYELCIAESKTMTKQQIQDKYKIYL